MNTLKRFNLQAKALFWLLLLPVAALGTSPLEKVLTFDEFRNLAAELAPKVNLFQEAWRQDPEAEFFGGTTRDYLYWLKGKFQGVKTREQALEVAAQLRNQELIDVRDFVIGESDVDIASKHAQLSAQEFGVTKIDSINKDRFNVATPMGKTELDQGFIPVEKIRLGKSGFVPWEKMGNGIREIYEGKPTVHFADPKIFAQTHYAKQKLNHEVLLALRYLRTVAINYYREHGKGYPDATLIEGMDPASREAVRKVFDRLLSTNELSEYLKQDRFRKWINGTIQKAYRSYTNQTATKVLFEHFHVDELVAHYGKQIEPINQFLFAKDWKYRQDEIARNLKTYGTSMEKLYQPASREFPGMKFIHGTRNEEAFRAILLQGALHSSGGTAGAGLYGVRSDNISFAESWGGSKDRVISFDIDSSARVIDITQGEGKALFERFGGSIEKFADAFGADILRYPYETRAYVVKNSSVLSRPHGLTRDVMTISKIMDRFAQAHGSAQMVQELQNLGLSSFSNAEKKLLLRIVVDRIFSEPEPWTKVDALKGVSVGNRFEEALAQALVSRATDFRELLDAIKLVPPGPSKNPIMTYEGDWRNAAVKALRQDWDRLKALRPTADLLRRFIEEFGRNPNFVVFLEDYWFDKMLEAGWMPSLSFVTDVFRRRPDDPEFWKKWAVREMFKERVTKRLDRLNPTFPELRALLTALDRKAGFDEALSKLWEKCLLRAPTPEDFLELWSIIQKKPEDSIDDFALIDYHSVFKHLIETGPSEKQLSGLQSTLSERQYAKFLGVTMDHFLLTHPTAEQIIERVSKARAFYDERSVHYFAQETLIQSLQVRILRGDLKLSMRDFLKILEACRDSREPEFEEREILMKAAISLIRSKEDYQLLRENRERHFGKHFGDLLREAAKQHPEWRRTAAECLLGWFSH